MAKQRRKTIPKLSADERDEVALLCAFGHSAADIADELGLDVRAVELVVERERKEAELRVGTLERLHATRRSLELRRTRASRTVRKFYASLPAEVSKNGHKVTHQSQLRMAVQLEGELARIDDRILRVDQQIAELEAKDAGSDRSKSVVVEVPVPGSPELGDLPDEGGGLSGHGDGQGTEDDADQ